MASTFRLDIVTPEKMLDSVQDAVSLVVPASEGYLGIMAGHAPIAAELVPGEIKITRATGVEQHLATSGGFLEVSSDRVTILADTAETPDEIDIERARAAYRRASDRLSHLDSETDIERARVALARAIARLTVAGQPVN